MNILVTGGCGFIGSHLVRLLLREGHRVVNLDKLTYAGNPANLVDLEAHPGYRFVRGDIADREIVGAVMTGVDRVINVAAETHVDRSIDDADAFLRTNVYGVHVLCEAVREEEKASARGASGQGASGRAEPGRRIRFVQVSTDEVYGSIDTGEFREMDRFSPSSPYSAAKAGGELLAFSYHTTHGLDVVATRGANTYGPNQYPEKLIPFAVTELIEGRRIPLYGDGGQVRDWLHVEDHARAIWTVAERGESGQAYNVPGKNERRNIEVVEVILREMARGKDAIEPVKDRPGHDRRYAVDGAKLDALGFAERRRVEEELPETVRWYTENAGWWQPLKHASKDFFQRHYGSLGRKDGSL